MSIRRVLLVDNPISSRDGVRAALRAEPSIEVVGEAADPNDAIEKAVATDPELVLMEIALPHG
jgi:two-component system, NarL family, response regulator NreC